jgi:hypothetical protein
MLQITKPDEWWAKHTRCPVFKQCPGRIVNIKCKLTGQVLYCCSECLTYFVGKLTPTIGTPCIGGRWYDNMLCLDEEASDSWELTEEAVTPTWDVDYYFKHIYNPHKSPRATKSITGDKGIDICPRCHNLELFRYDKDGRGHVRKFKNPKENRLKLLFIPRTGQRIQYCRFCGSIYPEYREPDGLFYGGTLDMYLALLGIIQFCEI